MALESKTIEVNTAPAVKSRRWLVPGSPVHRLLIALTALLAVLLFVMPFFADPVDRGASEAVGGTIDLSAYGPLTRPIELDGQWQLAWLGPDGPDEQSQLLRPVPGVWTGSGGSDTAALPQQGIARYSLVVRGLEPDRYRMVLPVIYGASRLSIDGREVSRRGVIGADAAGTRYELRAQDVAFDAQGGPVRLDLEIAAFHHRDNGLDTAPVLGLARPMADWIAIKWSREVLYNVSLLLIAVLALVGWLYRPADKASRWLGLACLCFLPSISILGFDNLLALQLPWLSFEAQVVLQYLTATLTIALFVLCVHAMFPQEGPAKAPRLIVAGYAAFFVIQLAVLGWGGVLALSRLEGAMFLPATLAVLVWVTGVVLLAALRGRDGAVVFLTGLGLFLVSFIVLTVGWAGWLPPGRIGGYELTALGIVMLLYSQVVLMAERWSLAVVRFERANSDLHELLDINAAISSDLRLDPLLDKIVAVTSRVTSAERASLFLSDPDSAELTSMVAQGTHDELKLSTTSGIAGFTYATGQVVNIADAYQDDRFNREIDEGTGYRTSSLLTVPITARDGRRIGVMQVLNRADGGTFDDTDITRIKAFAAQAAIAIDNARLFNEVVSARVFDESILRSMAGGVVALDNQFHITKLNAAAARILAVPPTLLIGLDVRMVLGQHNPWLMPDIEAVLKTGEPKVLFDVNLVTARESSPAVNLSLSPLQAEGGQVGALLVIDDISEGKRLREAMRRFMTQSVMDEVLERDDDILFGTACQASVVFADIRNFTGMAEQLSARETVETLNELFTELYEAIADTGGILDKYIGDSIMAVYGPPIGSKDDALDAVRGGVRMLGLLVKVNAARATRGQDALRLGIGVASGEVVAGTIGSPRRMDYTVIGDSVNLAARLEELTKHYQVAMLIDEATAERIGDEFPLREVDTIQVRGRQRPARIFEVLVDEMDSAVPG